MLKRKARYLIPFFVSVMLIVFMSYLLLSASPNKTIEGRNVLTLNCYIDVKSINLNNRTAIATLSIEIHGIQNVTVGGISKQPEIICIQISDSNNDELNCTEYSDYGNGTYAYRGALQDASWYLYNMGEGYPYDPTFIQLSVMYMTYSIDDTMYGAQVFDNYTYKMGDGQTQFSGINYSDLMNTWGINNEPNGEVLNVEFIRNPLMPTFIIIVPLAWLLCLVILSPSLITDRTTKVTFYSGILVFTPMFILAIQNFIAPRGTPSLPEFLGVTLMLISMSFLLSALPQTNPKESFIAEAITLLVAFCSIGFLAVLLFVRLLVIQWLPAIFFIGLLLVMLLTGYLLRLKIEDKRLSKQIEEEENRLRKLREEAEVV